jgi:hypothetical protein
MLQCMENTDLAHLMMHVGKPTWTVRRSSLYFHQLGHEKKILLENHQRCTSIACKFSTKVENRRSDVLPLVGLSGSRAYFTCSAVLS